MRKPLHWAVLMTTVMGAAFWRPCDAHAATNYYDRTILRDRPVVFYGQATQTHWIDSANGYHASFSRPPMLLKTRRGDSIPVFDGRTYAVRSDSPIFSPARSGELTVEAWLRPDALKFSDTEGTGYVHWAGKGERSGRNGNQEWALRMYSADNSEGRRNRVSGYAFSRTGGLGAGSNFQDRIQPGDWIHYVFVINSNDRSRRYPTGYTKVYRDGVLRDTDALAGFDVTLTDGSGKLRIGTKDGKSYFQGAIGKFAVYSYELSGSAVWRHYRASPLDGS